jgi:hypothetical protein
MAVVRMFGIDEAMTTRSVNETLIVALRDNAMAILKHSPLKTEQNCSHVRDAPHRSDPSSPRLT